MAASADTSDIGCTAVAGGGDVTDEMGDATEDRSPGDWAAYGVDGQLSWSASKLSSRLLCRLRSL